MKVYLDDERRCPAGWVLAKTAAEAIHLLNTEHVSEISLDHDLGPPEAGTGYDVICHIEEQVAAGKPMMWIYIHTANPAAAKKMHLCLMNIHKLDEANP